MAKLQIGEQSKPRFEFRSFGQNFDYAHAKMKELTAPVPDKVKERHSDEIYIMSKSNNVNNTKIRNDKMDIKTFIKNVKGLEQWNPLMKVEFPISKQQLTKDIFSAFTVDIPVLDKAQYTLEDFLEIIKAHPELQAVKVHKHRFGYMVNDTICEYAEVLINGAKVVSVNSESTEIDDILKTIKDLGLEGVENINYLQAIKRVIGMIDLPLSN